MNEGSLRLIGVGSDGSRGIAIKLDDVTAKPGGPHCGPGLELIASIRLVGELEDLTRLDRETPAIATHLGEGNHLCGSASSIHNPDGSGGCKETPHINESLGTASGKANPWTNAPSSREGD